MEDRDKTAGGQETKEEIMRRIRQIKLTVLDRETGQTRSCTLDEARTWDWKNPEVWRIVNGWQITSFQGLLNMLNAKAEKGYTEIEILESPRFMMLSGG